MQNDPTKVRTANMTRSYKSRTHKGIAETHRRQRSRTNNPTQYAGEMLRYIVRGSMDSLQGTNRGSQYGDVIKVQKLCPCCVNTYSVYRLSKYGRQKLENMRHERAARAI